VSHNTTANESGRILCPCTRCKETVLRQRQIADEHVEDYGRWDNSVIEKQIGKQTFDSRIMASFEQEIFIGQDKEMQVSKIEYCGRIQSIFQVDYRSFHMFLLDVQWFKAITTGRNPTVGRDGSGFVVKDSTKLWTNQSDTFVLEDRFTFMHIY